MKNTVTIILVILVVIGAIFLFKGGNSKAIGQNAGENQPAVENLAQSSNVKVENGVQIVEINVKGGYSPRKSIAKAGIPTVLRFNTSSTFDCSSAVHIPSYGISRNLPISGATDIELPASETGTLRGSCGMGMYPFEVVFN